MVPNKYLLAICRFLIGLVIGINSVLIPIYVREMSPVSVSGLTGSMVQAFINLGIFFASVSSLFYSIK
jgi:MFS family permease